MANTEAKPVRGIGSTKLSSASAGEDLSKSKSFLTKVAEAQQRKASERAKSGTQIAFHLILPNNMPQHFRPRDIIYIPEDYAKYEEYASLVENGPDGEPLIGQQEIRYVRNQNSIFVANQPENVVIRPIEMVTVNSFNDKKEGNKVRFLRLSNKNRNNPWRDGSDAVYYEVRPEVEAKERFERGKVLDDCISIIYSESVEKLTGMANALGITTTEPYLFKMEMKSRAESDPEGFLKMFNSPDLPIIERLSVALNLGIIKIANRSIAWRNNDTILRIPPTVTNTMEYLVEYVKSGEDGSVFLDLVDRELDRTLA